MYLSNSVCLFPLSLVGSGSLNHWVCQFQANFLCCSCGPKVATAQLTLTSNGPWRGTGVDTIPSDLVEGHRVGALWEPVEVRLVSNTLLQLTLVEGWLDSSEIFSPLVLGTWGNLGELKVEVSVLLKQELCLKLSVERGEFVFWAP